MSIKGVRVRPAMAIGVASVLAAALVAGPTETTGVVQAGDRQPTATTLPPEVVRQRPRPAPVATSTSAVAEVPDRPEPPAPPTASVTAPTTPATTSPEGLPIATTLPEEPPVEFDRLVLVGDSLAAEADPVIRYATPGKESVGNFFGGTAPCDWLDDDLEATPTSVVVITFTGNSLTPCMTDGSGAQLADEPLIEQYRADVGVLIDRATAARAWVVLVGQPRHHPAFGVDLEVEGINVAYQAYAATRPHVSYVDAGSFVETADGRYADRLPCLELDTDCAPDGTTVVRGDGVHFCPVAHANPCPVWSSGAARFGLAIASAANDPARYD